MNSMLRASLIALALSGTSLAACAQPLPYPPIPAPRVEVVPPAPSAVVTWQPGHWHWNGAGYQWIPGHYVERRIAAGHFVPGHWDWSPHRGYLWVPGHWA